MALSKTLLLALGLLLVFAISEGSFRKKRCGVYKFCPSYSRCKGYGHFARCVCFRGYYWNRYRCVKKVFNPCAKCYFPYKCIYFKGRRQCLRRGYRG